MKPVVDRLVSKYQGTADLYIYAAADKDPNAAAFAGTQGINGVPTTVVVDSNGREVKRFVGVTSEELISAAIESAK